MAKRNKKNIMFRTQKQSANGETKKFFAIFFSCVLLILLISCLAILNKYDFNLKSAVSGEAETETTTEVVETTLPSVNANETFLFWCASEDRTDMHFAWLVNVKMPERELTVCSVKPETVVENNGVTSTLEKIYSRSGENGFRDAVAEMAGIEIDGYAGSTPDGFKSMINYFGGVDITVPEQVEFRNTQITLLLIKGKQNMKGDTLYKYMTYLDTLGEDGEERRSRAVAEVFEHVFKPANARRCASIFSEFSNTLKTDFSIVKFSSSEQAVNILMENGFEALRTAESVSEFTEDIRAED